MDGGALQRRVGSVVSAMYPEEIWVKATQQIRQLIQPSSFDITLSEARSLLDQRRFSRPNAHFSALVFFDTYKKIIFSPANFVKFSKNFEFFEKFAKICLREGDFLGDLEKCCKTRIWT